MKDKSNKQKVEEWNKDNYPCKLEKTCGKNNYELTIDPKAPDSMKLKRPRTKKQVFKLLDDLYKSIS